MKINIDNNLKLELINENHSQAIFELVNNNREHLKEWLPFVDKMQTLEFVENYVKGSTQRNKDGNEYAFVIIESNKIIGRVGIYKIDTQNKIGEIGYWIAKDFQGRGIICKSCQAMIHLCFNELALNRIELKCGTENLKSQKIPEKLNFKIEGIIRQGELLSDKFIDLYLYSLLKNQ